MDRTYEFTIVVTISCLMYRDYAHMNILFC